MATKPNIFAKAKEKAAKSDKKNDKLIVSIKGENFDDNLNKIIDLESKIDQLTAELEMAKGVVKDYGIDAFNNEYDKSKGYPGSFFMESDSKSSIMFVPMDKYLKCDENRFNELRETYGDDVATEKTEFVMNPVLLEKYGEIISDFIQNCQEIDENDKSELFQAKVTYFVSKGAIEKAFTWGKGKVADFIRDIQPVFSMKSAKNNK